MKKAGFVKKRKFVLLFSLFLFVSLLSFSLFKSGIVTVSLENKSARPSPVADSEKSVGSVSSESAWLIKRNIPSVSPTSVKNTSSIPAGIPGEMTVSCVIDPNCGGGERITPLSVCDNSVCCSENGRYVQYWDRKTCGGGDQQDPEPQTQTDDVVNEYYYPVYISEPDIDPGPNYSPIYMEAFGQTYYCIDYRHTEILFAQDDYFRERDEVAKICANADASEYASCASQCSYENYNECEAKCYDQIDWECSVNITDSPSYRSLENLMSMHCR